MNNDNLAFLLATVSRLMRHNFHQRLVGSDLTLSKARALYYLSHNQGIRQSKLASLLEIQPITLARLIDQLVNSKLVSRREDPSDRRAYQLYLTQAATSHLTTIEKMTAMTQGEALAGFTQEEQHNLMNYMKKMNKNLSSW